MSEENLALSVVERSKKAARNEHLGPAARQSTSEGRRWGQHHDSSRRLTGRGELPQLPKQPSPSGQHDSDHRERGAPDQEAGDTRDSRHLVEGAESRRAQLPFVGHLASPRRPAAASSQALQALAAPRTTEATVSALAASPGVSDRATSELMRWGTEGDVSYVWKMRTQLVSARTVAEALVELATAPDPEFDAAETTEIARPREERLVEAARACWPRAAARACASRRRAIPPTPTASATRTGPPCPDRGAKLAGPTFEEWLDATVPASRA